MSARKPSEFFDFYEIHLSEKQVTQLVMILGYARGACDRSGDWPELSQMITEVTEEIDTQLERQDSAWERQVDT